jgi:hypothetical protein
MRFASVWAAGAIAAAAAFILGCGPDSPEDPPRVDICEGEEDAPADGKEAVILGTTKGEDFAPLAPKDPVELIHGPQGGQHIHISARLFALKPGKWQHLFEFVDAATGETAGGSRDLTMACAPGWNVAHNIRVYIDSSSIDAGTVKLESFLPPEEGGVEGESVKAEIAITLE